MRKIAVFFVSSRTRMLFFLLAVEILLLSFSSRYFLSIQNLIELTQFGAVLLLLALGESIVMLSGREGIDLSIGAILSLSGVIFGLLIRAGAGLMIALGLTVVVGFFFGFVNGLLISVVKIPSLIATLGTQYIFSSLALFLTGGIPISGFPESFKFLSLKSTFGIPNQILFVAFPVSAAILILMYMTKFGRQVYLLGTNPEAAKFAVIDERKIKIAIYMVAGLLASFGAIINNSWIMTARADAGTGLELQAITVACLGGIAVEGGKGSLGAVIAGVLVLTILNSGLQIANVNSVWQLAVLGIVLLAAVVFNQAVRKYLKI
ncbi:hypothetical protein BEQ56_10395 [Anaerolineaceae bacterium oral taxon 439]|nr:hypothetical protein BEQ56_10395 [Anaerolineaceae bacterium oral taxon 439]